MTPKLRFRAGWAANPIILQELRILYLPKKPQSERSIPYFWEIATQKRQKILGDRYNLLGEY